MMTDKDELKFIYKHLTDKPPSSCEFELGDKVTYTNDYGLSFQNRIIIGFAKEIDQYGQFIHLGGDKPYWMPTHPKQLVKEIG